MHTTEQPITIVTPNTNIFLRVLTPPLTDKPQVNPTFPRGQISLLQGISAIGDKFDFASTIGPSAATNIATGLYTGEASFFFGALPSPASDRDRNGLADAWELKYFGALGQDAYSRADADDLPFMIENAFDLTPTNNNLGSPRLPHFVAGTGAAVALVYSVPADEVNSYDYIPQLSSDLINWQDADEHPEYFSVTSAVNGSDTVFTVQPVTDAWPGDVSHLFLRLKIMPR